MTIYGVSFDLVGKQPIVLLKTAEGNKFLPIWIGQPEAAAILMKLQGASTPRPMTHDLLRNLISELDAHVLRIVINDLRDSTFFAQIRVSAGARTLEIDARPSDAIALALRTEAPIFVAQTVLDQAQTITPENVDDTDEQARKWLERLEADEDFGKYKM